MTWQVLANKDNDRVTNGFRLGFDIFAGCVDSSFVLKTLFYFACMTVNM